MKKSVSLVLLATILLQSCVVYQKTSVPLESAIEKGKAKLITTTGNKLNFRKIEKVDSIYYGTLNSLKYHIPPDEVEAIYLKDKKKSRMISLIIFSTVIVGLTVYIIVKIDENGII